MYILTILLVTLLNVGPIKGICVLYGVNISHEEILSPFEEEEKNNEGERETNKEEKECKEFFLYAQSEIALRFCYNLSNLNRLHLMCHIVHYEVIVPPPEC